MLKRVLDANKKAILVLPYVALVQEKLRWLRKAVEGIERNVELAVPGAFRGINDHRTIRVVPFFGNSKVRATLSDVDIAVCTIEKVLYPKASAHSAADFGRRTRFSILP